MHLVRSPRRIAPDMPPRAARLDPRAYCSRNPPPSHLPATRCALARCAGDCTPLSLTTPAYSRSQVQPLPSRKPRDASAAAHSPTLVTREPNPTALPLCEQESDSAPALHTGLSGSLSLPIQHAHALDQRHSTYRSLISLSALAGKLARMCLRRLEAQRHAAGTTSASGPASTVTPELEKLPVEPAVAVRLRGGIGQNVCRFNETCNSEAARIRL